MNAKELSELKKNLIAKKNDLLKVVDGKKQKDLKEEHNVGDEIDAAGESEEKELIFGLTDNEKKLLDFIESALRKIEVGKYGVCERCSSKIPYKRLEAMPYARYCIKCQPKYEQKK
ncbi:MAG: TraR/DksA family transcriptional regulator [Elusimicrobia bacterium]|nr:TraR/DksA family transcriptional regulator [Elusimicrobiota bacterium]